MSYRIASCLALALLVSRIEVPVDVNATSARVDRDTQTFAGDATRRLADRATLPLPVPPVPSERVDPSRVEGPVPSEVSIARVEGSEPVDPSRVEGPVPSEVSIARVEGTERLDPSRVEGPVPILGPVAAAGAAQTVASGAVVTLAGSGQDTNVPPLPVTFSWGQTGGSPAVSLAQANSPTATFVAPVLPSGGDPVLLTFTLTVSNGTTSLNATAQTTVLVMAPSIAAPAASAGEPQTVTSGGAVTLNGWAQDNNLPPRTLLYSWRQTGGPAVTLTGATLPTATFAAPTVPIGSGPVILGFELTVSHAPAASGLSILGPPTIDEHGVKSYAVVSSSLGPTPTIVRVLEPTNPVSGIPRRTLYVLPVAAGIDNLDSAYSDGLEELRLLDVPNQYNLTLVAPSFNIEPWYADHPSDPTRSLESYVIGDLVAFGDSFLPPGMVPQRMAIGLSKSAFGALTLILRHPSAFDAVAAWDGPVQFTDIRMWDMAGNYGTEANFDLYEIPMLVATRAPSFRDFNRMWVSGDTAVFTDQMALLHQQLLAFGILHTWSSGVARNHSWQSGWLSGAVAALHGNARPVVPVPQTVVSTTVTIMAPAAPTASAPATLTVASGSPVTLQGSGTDHNNPLRALTYTWTQIDGPTVTLGGANTATASFTAPALNDGASNVTLTFRLTVGHESDALIDTATTIVTVTAPPILAPTANAGADQTVASGAAGVTLSGSGQDHNTPTRTLTYAWTQISGPAVTLVGANTASPTFTAPALGNGASNATLTFRLTVGHVADAVTATATTNVTVTAPVLAPTASAGSALTVSSGSPVTLSGSGTDFNSPPRALTYAWAQISGTPVSLANAASAVATFTAPVLAPGAAGVRLEFTLTVNNGSAAAVAAVTVDVSAPPPLAGTTAGLVAAFDFNEGAGAAVADRSGFGNNGAISGATWTTAGRTGGALSFDGVSNWITVNDAPSLDVTTGLTVEAWVRPTTSAGWVTVAYKEGLDLQNPLAWALYSSDNTAPPALYTPTPGNQWGHAMGSSMLPLNAWSHVVGTYDGATARVYVNGALVGSKALPGSMPITSGPLRIGGHSFGNQFFKGLIDEVRIFNRPLSQAEIAADMNVSLPLAVSSVAPANLASSVAQGTAVTATFNQPLAPGSVTPASVVLTGPSAQAVPAAVGYDAATRVATLTPLAPLANLTTYTATIKGGAAGVADAFGRPLASDYTWTFTTALGTNGPAITALTVTPAATSAVIAWTTSRPATSRVDYGTSAGSLTSPASDASLVTAHSIVISGLTPNRAYFFRVTSTDAAAEAASAPAPPASPATFTTNPAGLVAALSFNEGSGSIVADTSGLGNNGTIGGATWTSAGRFGAALSFDGVSNWITVNDAPSLDVTTGLTIEAWVRPTASAGWVTVAYKEGPDLQNPLAWALYASDNTAPPALYTPTPGNQWGHALGSSMLPLNTWSHVVGTYDGATARVYVNGTLVGSKSLPGAMPMTTGPLRIGGHSGASGQFFKGLIDEIRIYNRALTATEIRADMTAPVR